MNTNTEPLFVVLCWTCSKRGLKKRAHTEHISYYEKEIWTCVYRIVSNISANRVQSRAFILLVMNSLCYVLCYRKSSWRLAPLSLQMWRTWSQTGNTYKLLGGNLVKMSTCMTRIPRMETGWNNSTLALRVIEDNEKGNPVPGDVTGPPCHWGSINTETWSCSLGIGR
jgi:hypothetical protein